jgi:hypothetical protein
MTEMFEAGTAQSMKLPQCRFGRFIRNGLVAEPAVQ